MKALALLGLVIAASAQAGHYILQDPLMGMRQSSTMPELNVDWGEVQKQPVYWNKQAIGFADVEKLGGILDAALAKLGAQGVKGKRDPYLCHLALENLRYTIYLRLKKNTPDINAQADIDHTYWYSRRRPKILNRGGNGPLENVGLVSGGTAEKVAEQVAQMWMNSGGHHKSIFPRFDNYCTVMVQSPGGVWYAQSIVSNGTLHQTRMGVEYATDPKTGNARITAVYPLSFGARNKLRSDDEVVSINDVALKPGDDLGKLLPKGPFKIGIRRAGSNTPEVLDVK